jgi:AcrR family transcriptional regulator
MLELTTPPESQNEAAPAAGVSARRAEVLDITLRLLAEHGHGVTMNDVSKAAACSKETLYKWFGDRDGLLAETVRFQASRVHVAAMEDGPLDRDGLERRLVEFAANWLTVISSKTSIALNRVAIGEPRREGRGQNGLGLGGIVLDNGRFALGTRLKPVLEAGRAAGLIAFDDAEEAFRTFFGLMARDVQIRLLLGDAIALPPDTIRADAEQAARNFFILHAPKETPAA